MKKFISVLCILTVLIGMFAIGSVGASAVDAAQTIVDVKAGDEVTYVLKLSDVPERIVGCDSSIYYDDDILELVSAADFSDSTDPDEWETILNPDLKGEVKCVFSILNGVNFSKQRNFVTLNFKAKTAGSAHISYYFRFLYGNSAFESDDRPQISEYTFTCDVTVNSAKILEDAQPELNTEKPQSVGTFVNSKNGKGEDADVNVVDDGSSGNNGATSGGNSGNTATTAPVETTIGGQPTDAQTGTVAPSTSVDGNTTAPEQADSTASSDAKSSGGSMLWLWIVIITIVVLAGAGIAVFTLKNKKKDS